MRLPGPSEAFVLFDDARERNPGIADDGRRRILAGQTTLEEVLRVTAG